MLSQKEHLEKFMEHIPAVSPADKPKKLYIFKAEDKNGISYIDGVWEKCPTKKQLKKYMKKTFPKIDFKIFYICVLTLKEKINGNT